MHQTKRMAVYESFSRKQRSVLFATDIAARGLGNNIVFFFLLVFKFLIIKSIFFLLYCLKHGSILQA